MKLAAVLLPLALAAYQERPSLAASAPHCAALDKVQQSLSKDKDTTVAPMNHAQFLVLTGMYLRDPETPEGLPPGDGALIIYKDSDGAGMIAWTQGIKVCDPWLIGDARKLIKVLDQVKDGPGEKL